MRRIPFAIAILLSACTPAGNAERQALFDQTSANPVEQGKRLALVLGCTGCHGEDLTGTDWSAKDFVTMSTANLTRAAERYDTAQFENAVRHGKRPQGRELWEMPSHLFTALPAADLQPVIAYIKAQPPRGEIHPDPVFFANARKEMAQGIYKSSTADVQEIGLKSAPDAGPEHARAQAIVRATCVECHGIELRGGEPFPGAPFRPDLRIVGAYDKAAFLNFLQTGKAAGDRELKMMSGVARGRYAHFTPAEREAVYNYLVALAAKNP